jgi:hypothetical protein
MDASTKVSHHLSILNGIIYKHIKLALIYGKNTLSFEKFVSKNIVEVRRLKIEDNTLPKPMMVSRGRHAKKTME